MINKLEELLALAIRNKLMTFGDSLTIEVSKTRYDNIKKNIEHILFNDDTTIILEDTNPLKLSFGATKVYITTNTTQ